MINNIVVCKLIHRPMIEGSISIDRIKVVRERCVITKKYFHKHNKTEEVKDQKKACKESGQEWRETRIFLYEEDKEATKKYYSDRKDRDIKKAADSIARAALDKQSLLHALSGSLQGALPSESEKDKEIEELKKQLEAKTK